ncbi:MAG: phosphatase PAP2 family protein [Candidatus Pristimantibacillus lignocellulolyticus]|uniref:Phosphatase PAP2 family protein n=1 Tax=Candidatus Pristimantibacillus lignocellulolyticus TaxID=2994561 RepID=A0A9J6ZA80_9BACL|nr:MAG: phosphatase PAP2 family protein [Candidatus Pristimantibacillus lignocellulolyticus]
MKKWISRLRTHEERLLIWANRRLSHHMAFRFMHNWMNIITHLGGATFTISFSLLLAIAAKGEIAAIGWKCLTTLAISHIPVALLKHKFRRLRPYQSLPDVNIGLKPLEDPSFPSGHTTAIFALIVPILLNASLLPFIVVPLALIVALSVAWSRMYLGLHYPSDILAGGVIGTITAYAVEFFWHSSSGI